MSTSTSRSAQPGSPGEWVEIDLAEDAVDTDHLITPEERLRVAMARQEEARSVLLQRRASAVREVVPDRNGQPS